MNNTILEKSKVEQLAYRLEHDIRTRNLSCGDRYLTAIEAGHLLGVSKTTADRAMRILTQQGLLQRRRNRGSYIGAAIDNKPSTPLRVVCGLLPEDFKGLFHYGLLMQGVCEQMTGLNQMVSFLPKHDSVEHVREMLKFAGSGAELAGVVAISCPREVYAFLADSDLPTVVLGSFHVGDPSLPSVDADHRESGRLLTRLLLDRGHRRIALMNPTESRPGENDFFDGVSEILSQARLPHNALVVRAVPHEDVPFSIAVREVLSLTDRPTAFIARYQHHAKLIATVTSEIGLCVPDDVQIVFRGQAEQQSQQSDYPHAVPRMRLERIGALIGEMLDRISADLPLEQTRVVIPVELHV
ncbi:MAG: substrate-binding domain-containing protein [Pirellulales bacterium]|nr:substrate-binding domain-containing protein [Pirellulales bacterium]